MHGQQNVEKTRNVLSNLMHFLFHNQNQFLTLTVDNVLRTFYSIPA